MDNPTLINPGTRPVPQAPQKPPENPMPTQVPAAVAIDQPPIPADLPPAPPQVPQPVETAMPMPTPPIPPNAPATQPPVPPTLPVTPATPDTAAPAVEKPKSFITQNRITLIVAGITGIALIAMVGVYVIFTQLQTPVGPAPTPTPTPTATISDSLTPTPFPTVIVKKNFQIELLDSQGLVTKVAEFTPEGELVTLTDTLANSPHVYRKTDTQGKTTEIGETSPDGKLRMKRTQKTLELGSTDATATLKNIATAPDNQFIEGRFVSNTEYFFYYYASACGWEGICEKLPKSAYIYDSADTKKPLRAIPNDKEIILANYVGTTTTHHLLTGVLKGKTDSYYLLNRTSYVRSKITIPSAKYETLLWGPEVDGANGRLFYMSEGFGETAEITMFDLPKNKESVLTDMPTLIKKSEIDANNVLSYTVTFFKEYKLAYVTLTHTNKAKTPNETLAKYYLFSLPDEQAKEITPDPILAPLLEGKAFGKIAWNKDFSQGIVVLDEMKTVLVIDASDPFKPIGKKIQLLGILPAYANLRAGGWKE